MLRAVSCCTHHCRQTLSFCLVCINLQKLHANTTMVAEYERLLGGCSETISVKSLQNRNEFLLNGGKPYSTWNLECHSPNVCQVKPNAKRYTKKRDLDNDDTPTPISISSDDNVNDDEDDDEKTKDFLQTSCSFLLKESLSHCSCPRVLNK